MRMIPCKEPVVNQKIGVEFAGGGSTRCQRYADVVGRLYQLIKNEAGDNWYRIEEGEGATVIIHVPATRYGWATAGFLAGVGAAGAIAMLFVSV